MAEKSSSQKIKIAGLRLKLTEGPELTDALSRVLDIPVTRIASVRILRRSLDARQRVLHYVYTLAADVSLEHNELTRVLADPNVSLYQDVALPPSGRQLCLKHRPIVVGAGPAGLFAALGLAERGCPPLVLERGGRITDRIEEVQSFWKHGELDPESNVVFGEGGAGAFSDGKLTARGTSPFKQRILEELVACGADKEILYDARPHVGTDRLRRIIPALVDRLRKLGVEFAFNTRMDDIEIEQDCLKGIQTTKGRIVADNLFLAVGHSARDTLRMLSDRGMQLLPKGFAVGVRIEHPQVFIDRSMYRDAKISGSVGAAEYSVRFTDTASTRGVYSFCMCPGGQVIGCSSQPGTLCVNGMSFSTRSGPWANAALVVTVGPDDSRDESVLGGIVLQEQIERAAYTAVSQPYYAPVQRAVDFVKGCVPREHIPADTSYKPGVTPADFTRLLPEIIVGPLQRALQAFEKKIPGFIEQGVLVGVETRTSSPVRMLREPETYSCVGISGLFPTGEGAGYAGGIVSSAVDGFRSAWSGSCRTDD